MFTKKLLFSTLLGLSGMLALMAGVALAQSDEECDLVVEEAVAIADEVCTELGRNTVCYGNTMVSIEGWDNTELAFSTLGDIGDIETIAALRTSPLNVDDETWGIAIMALQVNVLDTLPGQNVTFVVFGDAEIVSQAPSATGIAGETVPMQAFALSTGIGHLSCNKAPSDGLLIQTPQGMAVLKFEINEVQIEIGSTVFIQSQPDDALHIYVLDGQITIEALGTPITVARGQFAKVSLDSTSTPNSEPSETRLFALSLLSRLPLELLPEPLTVIHGFAIGTPGNAATDDESSSTGTDNDPSSPIATTFVVSGTTHLASTGITLTPGQTYTVSVTGEVNSCIVADCPPTYNQWVSATGIPGNVCDDCTVVGVAEMSLVGSIGSGSPFYIGAGGTFTADTDGELFLGVNDGFHTDNSGFFVVTIVVS